MVKKGREKGKSFEVIKRKLDFENITHLSLSALQVRSYEGFAFYMRQ